MKILKYISILTFVLIFCSCEDYFGENANVDPDNPIQVTANVILPQVQARMTYTYGGDFTRYLGINTQHVDGVGRQFAVIGNYGIQPNDVDQAWSNIYSGTLNSNRKLRDLAAESGFAHYQGISLALEAYTIMMATDAWGDIPYSNALNFDENGVYAPTIDTQEDIYTAVFALLDEARTLIAGDNGGNPPGSDDLMYGGNMANWAKFCNVLEARGRLHLSKRDADAHSKVLTALGKGKFDSAGEEAGFAFGLGATENAPWYQYIEQRDDCEVGAGYVALLESMNDPRLTTYGFTHELPHPVFTQDQVVKLLSFTEQEFMRAEAMMATGNATGSYAALVSGVTASFAEAGAGEVGTYLSDNGITESSISMSDIMTQKYIALYTSPETFNDWRRTGMPSLTPITGTEVPRRLPYAEAEQFSNSNIPTPADISIFDRVWWDM